jgi:hypothetical protein
MGAARSTFVDPTRSTLVATCSRCVERKHLLCGPQRQSWIAGRLSILSLVFAIDVVEFAVLENHIHLLLALRPELAWCWTDREVARRWLALRGTSPSARDASGIFWPTEAEIDDALADPAEVDVWRRRLADLGWFHKELKEPCARIWNREDEVSGSFWQGRYGSKVVLDDAATLQVAVYVLLNRTRAGLERELGQDERSSIGARVRRLAKEIRRGEHADAVRAFHEQFVDGVWTPVHPADPGSAALLGDEEYAARVAEGRRRHFAREAKKEEARRLACRAEKDPIDAIDAIDEVRASRRRPAKTPRHRSSQRSPGRSASPMPQENPFAPHRTVGGAVPVLGGMTLGALIDLADAEGRKPRPGRVHLIPVDARRAVERIRGEVLGEAVSTGGCVDQGAARAGPGWMGRLSEGAARAAARAAEAMARDMASMATLLAGRGRSDRPPVVEGENLTAPPPTTRWFGPVLSVEGAEHLRGLAARLGRRCVVACRPIGR